MSYAIMGFGKIRPYVVAGESCSWRATMTAPQRRLGQRQHEKGITP
jgi:hypothetical protein